MLTITASKARAQFLALLDQVAASHEPILITGKRNNAVLISEEDWRAINEIVARGKKLQLVAFPAESLRELTGIISVGGDALIEAEEVYDDCNY